MFVLTRLNVIFAVFGVKTCKMKDLAIIGGGPAGYTAAERAAAGGLEVVLFEKRELGGVCLNEGCIPTKTLLYGAKVYDTARGGDKYGVAVEGASFDYGKMVQRKNKVVRKLVAGIGMKMKKHGVEVVKGEATIAGRDGDAFVVECGGATYRARNLMLATGSEAFMPPVEGIGDSEHILTNREILELKELPQSLVVVGGGVIGMEFASLYNSLGCEVTVIEMMPEILGANDSEISGMLREIYTRRGIHFHMECWVNRIEGGTVHYTTITKNEHTVTADKILISVGRKPVVASFGLESLGVEMHRSGVRVDEKMRTSVPGVYAVGDITGHSLLAHTAVREAEVVVNNLLGGGDAMKYDAIPAVVYTNPEVASVGMTVQQAMQSAVDVKVASLPMTFSGRFVAENEQGTGVCRIVAAEEDGRVLGVHMLGNPASEMIFGAAIAIERKMTVEELKRVVFPHPTVSEIIKETLYEFE